MRHREGRLKPLGRRQFLESTFTLGVRALAAGLLVKAGEGEAAATTGQSMALTGSISVDVADVRHSIAPTIYGTFIEHIGRCIYGGLYEEGSPLSDEQGFRKDVIQAAREWAVPVLRWPGGDFASGYHWLDGIGPKESRPRRYNAAWFEEESNHFGTDEFIRYCRRIGAEPYICVNLGTGTIEEAANWVEYCNGTGNTYYASLRRRNGHDEPHQVRFWGLGNEVYGPWQIGHKDAEDYAKIALECAKLMKWVDPTIRLIACGSDNPDWNRVVLEKLVNVADYISLHDYEGTDDYYELLGTIQRFERRIHLMDSAIDLTDPLRGKDAVLALSLPNIRTKKRIEIACDEWNVWYRKRDIWRRDVPNPVEERYNLRDALWVASVLNLFHRLANKVTLANIAQMANAIGAMFTSQKGMFRQTIYFPMKLYRQECGSLFLACRVESPTFSSKTYQNVPYLDVSATAEEGKSQVALAVVNRHQSSPITARVEVRNAKVQKTTKVFEINGASPDAENSFSDPDNIKIQMKDFPGAGDQFTYVFPAHSVTLLKLATTKG